jgi:1-acyl-sn-glycerol-3-phosphate acyltransferase
MRRAGYLWRLLATGCSFILFGVGGLILGYLVFPTISLVSPSNDIATRRCRHMVQRVFRGFVGFMAFNGILSWDAPGRQLLNRPGQLIVANHPSLIDIVFLISMIPNATCIVKSDLYRNMFTRGPVSWANYIANDSPHQLVEDCVAALASGASLVVFPEGTRSVSGLLGHFKRGAAHVLLQAECPLVLATIQSKPPMLAKQDKWYEIPMTKARYTIHIADAAGVKISSHETHSPASARDLTRSWRDYFEREVKS